MELKEEVRKDKKDEKQKKNTDSKFVNFMKGITIEPMTVLISLHSNLVHIPQDQMLLYKTCMEDKYNVSDDFCTNIEEHTNTTQYSDIEAEMSSFYNYISLAEHAVPILLSFYLGSWSDHQGRKPFIYICMTGMLLSSVMNMMSAIYLQEWDKWVWLFTVILSKNVFGGSLAYVMVVYSFIADNSNERQRTIRMAILSFLYHMSVPISAPIGVWLFGYGYVHVFAASLVLMVLAYIYMFARLWNFEEKLKSKEKLSFSSMLHPRHVKDSFTASFKGRPDHKRTYLLIMLSVMLLNMMPSIGEGAYQYLFVKRTFSWGVPDYSWYRTTASLVSSLAMFVLFPLFHRFKINDNLIIILSCISQIGGALLRGFSTHSWMFYLSTAVDFGTSIVSPPIRAQISHCVEPHELGKIFGMLASIESLIPIIGTIIYSRIYNATRELPYPLPGSCYFVSCGFIGIGLFLTTAMALSLSCRKIPTAGKAKQNQGNSNSHPEVKQKDEIFVKNYAINQNIW